MAASTLPFLSPVWISLRVRRPVARSIPCFIAVYFVLFTLATGAWAQTLRPVTPPPVGETPTVLPPHTGQVPKLDNRVAYSIRTITPGERFDVRIARNNQVVARCIGKCTLALPLGSYAVHLYNKRGEPNGDTNFDVSSPGTLEVQDANESAAAVGATMGISGIALIIAGTLLTISSICVDESIHTDDCPHGSDFRAAFGVSSIGLGAVLTPIGWVMFAHNHSARAHEGSLLLPYGTTTSDHRGGILGLQGSF